MIIHKNEMIPRRLIDLKRFTALFLSLMLLVSASAMADSAVDTIMNTGTTQAFTNEAVSEEDLVTILRAGLAAESAINQQPWFFVAITNPEVLQELGGSGSGFAAPGGSRPEGAPEGGFPGGAPEGGFPGSAPEGGAPAGMPEGAPAGNPGSAPGGFSPSGSGAKASLGSSPAAIIIYKNTGSKSPNADYDCGLATQNMVIAAASLGYGVKIVSSPTMTLNGNDHDAICEKLGVDKSMQAVAVLLIGHADESTDATTAATTRDDLETKTSIIK